MAIERVEIYDGKFQFDPKGIGMQVLQKGLDGNGTLIKASGKVKECVYRVQLNDVYELTVDYLDGVWGDFHLIPHQEDAAKKIIEAHGYTSSQLWMDKEGKVIPNSGFRIQKTVTQVNGENLYNVTIEKFPDKVTIKNYHSNPGAGKEQTLAFSMKWDKICWKKVA